MKVTWSDGGYDGEGLGCETKRNDDEVMETVRSCATRGVIDVGSDYGNGKSRRRTVGLEEVCGGTISLCLIPWVRRP